MGEEPSGISDLHLDRCGFRDEVPIARDPFGRCHHNGWSMLLEQPVLLEHLEHLATLQLEQLLGRNLGSSNRERCKHVRNYQCCTDGIQQFGNRQFGSRRQVPDCSNLLRALCGNLLQQK